MFRNYLAAALRNLARNRLYTAINTAGLAVGFAAAILIGLFARHELSFDRFLPGHESVFRVSMALNPPGGGASASDVIPGWIPEQLELEFPQIEAMTRVAPVPARASLKVGDIETIEERFYWADANLFDVLPLRAIAGDLKSALARPDGLVLTRRMARKYFGRDTPLGDTLDVDRTTTLTVTAVLEDLPPNTHLSTEVLGSAVSRDGRDGVMRRAHAYLRLAPGSAPTLRAALPAFIDRHMPSPPALGRTSDVTSMPLVSLGDIHLHPPGALAMTPAGDPRTIRAMALVGLLILLVASINYVNLMTVCAAGRAVEVAMRKTSGGRRRDLVAQFVGESLIYAVLGMAVALALVELTLPYLNASLGREIDLRYTDLPLLGAILGLVFIAGAVGGAYPALVMSSFRPALVLKGGRVGTPGSARVRQALVVAQFAILVGLLVATAVVYRQTAFGMRQGLHFETDQLLLIEAPQALCEESAFRTAVESLPGVRGAACSANLMSDFGTSRYRAQDGTEAIMQSSSVGAGLFELMGFEPVAGRFFERGREADALPPVEKRSPTLAYHVVINETAARKLGFAPPSEAIGRTFAITTGASPREIIGVVPDFLRDSVRQPIEAMFYENSVSGFAQLNVKLKGSEVPETLRAIDALWDRTARQSRPIERMFYDQRVRDLYRDLARQSSLLAQFAAAAVLLAGLGLFGLAAFTSERRTREIGIRKAMGAETSDVLRLLLWQFSKPVLSATLIAWPIAAYVMSRWLQGFAYRTDLSPWLFVAGSAVALAISLLTVGAHSILVARARPVAALRHE